MSSSKLCLDPGYSYAHIILFDQLADTRFHKQRIRVVGSSVFLFCIQSVELKTLGVHNSFFGRVQHAYQFI